ncbi:MAG: hypothetical protein N2738_05480 [Thermodesulfovibrionales bacterium]|nr:hypothetical protein [Thermodesulfovibrionales bacterium]
MIRTVVFFLILIFYPSYIVALDITADNLIYHAKEGKYELRGNVLIKYQDTMIKTNNAIVYDGSFDVIVDSKVSYEDKETVINATSANFNLKTKTGEINKAVIFFKEGNYWITSPRLQKLSDDRYFADTARFTTCNPSKLSNQREFTHEIAEKEAYDWCFQGRDVDITLGKSIDAKEVTYRVKDMPIIFIPKLWAPINTERATGFLMPIVGNSSQKGLRIMPSFFWAIDDDKDMTLGLDYYSKRGIGKSLQYRYINPESKGVFNVYHLKDKVLDDSQFQITAQQEFNRGSFREFIDINYVKSIDMYKDYSYMNQDRSQRFLQSSVESALSFSDSRLYMLGQYWIDLKQTDKNIPQVLPSLGYYLKPSKIGPFMFEMESTITNFYRQEGVKAQRFDIMPMISHSFGNEIQISQSLAIRESAYNFQEDKEGVKNHRETLRYKIQAQSRFVKRYDSFEHIIEPSINYQFIPNNSYMPLFDSVEAFNNISETNLSLLNLFRFQDRLVAIRLRQPYSFKKIEDGQRLGLTILEGAYMTKPFILRIESAYDFNERQIDTFYTDLIFALNNKTNIIFGERFSRQQSILQYRTAIDTTLTNRWAISANLWFDAKGGGLRDSTVRVKYIEQCWAINLSITRRPRFNDQNPDYSVLALVELQGVGSFGKK